MLFGKRCNFAEISAIHQFNSHYLPGQEFRVICLQLTIRARWSLIAIILTSANHKDSVGKSFLSVRTRQGLNELPLGSKFVKLLEDNYSITTPIY